MSQLAELMRHTTPATTGLVERLVEAGLIERFSHPKDRRQVLVRITDKGRELVEGLKRGIVRNLQELFKDLTQEDVEAWLRIYRTIIRRSTQQQAAKAAAA
jgi:DNA-binding MarR family transcriptional regulator